MKTLALELIILLNPMDGFINLRHTRKNRTSLNFSNSQRNVWFHENAHLLIYANNYPLIAC